MGRLVLVIPLFFSVYSNANSFPQIIKGQCFSEPDSKIYLSNLQTSPGLKEKIKTAIGTQKLESLANSPEAHFYFCQLNCLDHTENLDRFWVTLSANPSEYANMDGFLCPSIKIENKRIVGEIFSPQPTIIPFNSFDSTIPEVHEWLQKIKFTLTEEEYNNRFSIFKEVINKIVTSYLQSGNAALFEAGRQLWEIAYQTDVGVEILKTKMQNLEKNNWKPNIAGPTIDFFIETPLATHGRFLKYKNVTDSGSESTNP